MKKRNLNNYLDLNRKERRFVHRLYYFMVTGNEYCTRKTYLNTIDYCIKKFGELQVMEFLLSCLVD